MIITPRIRGLSILVGISRDTLQPRASFASSIDWANTGMYCA